MGRLKLKGSNAQISMLVGVQLRTQLMDATGAPTTAVVTGGSHRTHATNLGIISYQAHVSTTVIGNGVTDARDASSWTVLLLLRGSPGAKGESQADTKLKVTEPRQSVVFRTMCKLEQLMGDPLQSASTGYYESLPLDVFGTTS